MLLNTCTLIAYHLLFVLSHGNDRCDIFRNRYMVKNGKFQDVCGPSTFKLYNGGSLYSSDETYDFTGSNMITFQAEAFSGNRFAFIIEARRTGSSRFDIILGPGSKNCQIRYESPNKLGIYSYYQSPAYWQSFTLPDDVDKFNTLILYYDNGKLSIYQNGKKVKDIVKSFDIEFSRMGGWYSSRPYYADIAVKNIMFVKDKSLTDIQDALDDGSQPPPPTRRPTRYPVRRRGEDIPLALAEAQDEASDTDELTGKTDESGSITDTAFILMGVGAMLVFIVLCCGIYWCYKKKKNENDNDKLKGAQVLQQIEMADDEIIDDEIIDDEIIDDEIINEEMNEDETNDESKQITNTNEI